MLSNNHAVLQSSIDLHGHGAILPHPFLLCNCMLQFLNTVHQHGKLLTPAVERLHRCQFLRLQCSDVGLQLLDGCLRDVPRWLLHNEFLNALCEINTCA